MTLTPAWRTRLFASVAAVVAVVLGVQLATGEYAWPVLAAGALLGGSLVVAFRVPLDALVMGVLIFGYMVGNRGFAQLMPSTRVPMLPAEIGLLLAGGWVLIASAQQRTLPFRRDLLNACVLAWLIAGTIRVFFDVRPFGFVAVRDYAMIYYASFFFIAQHACRDDSRRFLLRVLVTASVAQPIAMVLAEVFPEFFFSKFAIRGVPLIFFKGDLALTFTGISALLLFFGVRGPNRFWAWPVATFELMYVIAGANRASMLGALAALAWLAFSRARRFVWIQISLLGLALLIVSGLALLTENTWAQRKFEGARERVASIADVMGRGTYVSDESGMKGDNNRFRAVWWRTVVEETMEQNPAFGLGFGYDLARSFLREYNPDMADDFTARSPHSIVVTTIGRMGFVGLALLLTVMGAIAMKTWRVVRNPDADPATLGIWSSIWVILVSACFGVVLEGPMGAVVFWSLLGIGSALIDHHAAEPGETVSRAGAALQHDDSRHEVIVSHSRIP